MHTQLAECFAGMPEGQEAKEILGRCVHCGFCTATCPTYQLWGDELDSPRGRIYLIKQMLEGESVTEKTQRHLDRCLTCRNCETTCPSGVEYGRLVDIGRNLIEQRVARPWPQRVLHYALKTGLTSRGFNIVFKWGQTLRWALPRRLRRIIPARQNPGPWPKREHSTRVILLAGCVQPAMLPNIHHATARVLDAIGVQTIVSPSAGCCGAIRFHLNDSQQALNDMRRNIDAWWPWVEQGAQAILMNATGCGVMVKDYGYHLRHDPMYAERAARISAMTQDLCEYLPTYLTILKEKMRHPKHASAAFHPPCTLQHGQSLSGRVEALMTVLGFHLQHPADSHLCCGSAGTYSILHPAPGRALRDRKLIALEAVGEAGSPILSANIGCILHLQSGTSRPVRHWIEWIDQALHD